MAKFYLLECPNPVWINIDSIVSMYYDKEEDRTYIFSCDDPSEHFTINGDITSLILNANNEITMKDKLFCSYLINRCKGTASSIVSKLDSIYKFIDRRFRS